MEGWTRAVADAIKQNEAAPCARWLRTARAVVLLGCSDLTLLAGWVAADQEIEAGSEVSDALRVGWSVVERLRRAESRDRDPYTIACRHLRNCALADYQEAWYYVRRRRARPRRRLGTR